MARRKTTPFSDALSRIASHPAQAEQLLEAGLGSAMAIARGSVDSLLQRVPGLDGGEARRLHQRASALAVLAARHYREQRLTAASSASQAWRTGLRALVDGPTFDSQFNPSWSDNCAPGAIEASTSPAAYLTALFQWVTTVIEPQANTEEDEPILLAQRRPDLAALILDNHSLERVEPTLGIVNEVLEGAARKHLDDHNQKTRSVDDALLETRYPFALPFERYLSQINAILGRRDYSLGDLVRQLDPDFPYFCRVGLHSLRSDEALQMDTALGPEQRALLLEAAYFPRGARRASSRSVQTRTNPRSLLREPLHSLQNGFYPRHYGVESAEELLPLTAFCLRSGLNQDGVESLLSIERYAPLASPNVPGLAAPSPAQFGSVYINAGETPALGVSSVDGEHRLSDWTNDHFDRLQRMARLARWLDLPFGDTDLLVDAALQAEHGEAGRGREITENTLRALGLFRRLRRDFDVSAEDFAALLQGLGLYVRGSGLSQFDRVFNDPTLFSDVLVLDNSAFNIIPQTEAEYRKIHHLCGALGISYETYLYLARYIVQGDAPQHLDEHTATRLSWSHAVVSAFYRLTRLPAWLGLSSVEVLALLQLIGERGHQYVSHLVSPTLRVYQHSELGDTLSVVQSLTDTVQWLRANDLDVDWLYQHLMPLAPVAAASDRELDLLRQIAARMLPTLLSEASFRDAGVPMMAGVDLPTAIDWLAQLELFVSPQGLILELKEYPDNEAYEAALHERLEAIVDALELADGPHVLVRVFQLVMDARSAQRSLVWESLANLLGGSAELSQELLGWAGGTSFQLLEEVLELFDGTSEPLPVPVGDDVLALLARLTQRMGIVARLELSPLALRCWWQQRDWFEGPAPSADGPAAVTFAQLHLLVQYRHLLEFADQDEQAVLDYLKLVNNLPPDLSEHNLQLIREDAAGKIAGFTGFSIRDILETGEEISANGLIVTVRQLDHLVRLRQACQTLQLGTSAAIELSHLRNDSSREAYRSAAEGALSSLTAQLDGQVVPSPGELGQSETSWIVVDTQRLVARTQARARCLLTVKNFLGEPMADIHVTWETSLSGLDAPPSDSTDVNGQVWVDLQAGDEMGSAQVIARFGLDRQIFAPLVLIDCDDTSLTIKDPVFAPPEALAGNLQVVEYRLQLTDTHGNPGRDRVLQWSTDLGTFERPQTRTDADGFALARLRSRSSGQALVVADVPVNGEQHPFEPVIFLEQQYFQYVRFNGPLAAGQAATATCRVVNLDGSPQGNVTVLWSADFGDFVEDPAKSISDADGIAVITYLAKEPGEVTLTINARYDNKDLQPLSTERTTVHELPTLVEMEPAEQYFVIHQARPAAFRVRLEPAAAGYPLTWWEGEMLIATTYTSADGTATYQRHFTQAQLGEQVVTVRSIRDDDHFDFKVKVVTPHTELLPEKGPDSPGMVPVNPAQGKFAVEPGLASNLVIKALRSDGSGDNECRLTFTLGAGADPASLGVTFEPALGEPVSCDVDGKVTLRIDCTEAAFLPNSDPYNNEIIVQVMSNLGVSLELRLRLRELLDLAKSELQAFRGMGVLGEYVVLTGRLRRRNGDAPLNLREGGRLLRINLENFELPNDVELRAYDGNPVWVHAPLFLTTEEGEMGARFTFSAPGDLGKRVQFAGSAVHEIQAFIRDATLELSASADPDLIEEGSRFIVDAGGSVLHGFTLTLRGEQGPIAGIPLLPKQYQEKGAVWSMSGPTDEKGQVHIEVDSSKVLLGEVFGMAVSLGHLSRSVMLSSRELVVTKVTLGLNGEKQVQARVECSRREGRTFSDTAWQGYFQVVGGTLNPFSEDSHPQGVTLLSKWLPTSIPGTLRIALTTPTSTHRYLIGETEFPITDDLPVGDGS